MLSTHLCVDHGGLEQLDSILSAHVCVDHGGLELAGFHVVGTCVLTMEVGS